MFLAAFKFILFRQPTICKSERSSSLARELACAPTTTPPWLWLIEVEAIYENITYVITLSVAMNPCWVCSNYKSVMCSYSKVWRRAAVYANKNVPHF